jgi:hypothetical protein
MDLEIVVQDIANVLKSIDSSAVAFRHFQPGVGPYGEPQLVKLLAAGLNRIARYGGRVKTMRSPDLLIEGDWAMEIKIARPFGDNGKAAENWSVNLLHPYSGNTSFARRLSQTAVDDPLGAKGRHRHRVRTRSCSNYS